jgi:hypothetical protein
MKVLKQEHNLHFSLDMSHRFRKQNWPQECSCMQPNRTMAFPVEARRKGNFIFFLALVSGKAKFSL